MLHFLGALEHIPRVGLFELDDLWILRPVSEH